MVTEQDVQAADAPEEEARRKSWGEIATDIAWPMILANSDQRRGRNALSRGDLADLRRMDLDQPPPVVIRLMVGHDELAARATHDETYRKWALILHGLALMTPKSFGDGKTTAHDAGTSVGQALHQAGYSASRLHRLLTARGRMQQTLLARMFKMLAAADQRFNWNDMAQLIRYSDFDEERAEWGRRKIASDYYRAQYSSKKENNETQ